MISWSPATTQWRRTSRITGEATLSIPVPNDPTLRGVALSTQALVLSGNGEFYLTNTATLAVK
jgi:hypothetical protein